MAQRTGITPAGRWAVRKLDTEVQPTSGLYVYEDLELHVTSCDGTPSVAPEANGGMVRPSWDSRVKTHTPERANQM